MTAEPTQNPAAVPLIQPFPQPGRLIEHAYWELALAANGTPEQQRALGDLRRLPRPWDPPTCTHHDLRLELWVWLDDVVTWINHDDIPHTATSDEKDFDSPVLDTDEQFAFRFDEPGTYTYFCKLHPHMSGTIEVVPKGG